MKRNIFIVFAACLLVSAAVAPAPASASAERIDVVFVLDTTGSMSGLIEGAKAKIWSIAGGIVDGEPAPELRVGLVAYRDVGDDYVTRVFDLSDDLDEVYANLASFNAAGGGDGPEHVNRALDDAVAAMSWDRGAATLRVVFLVGDAPPHLDYEDGYDFHATCARAAREGIIVNTLQCGAAPETAEYWREIARLAEGEYAAIPQEGGVRTVATPMDDELAALARRLDATVVAWGDEKRQAAGARAEAMASEMPASEIAERADFKVKSGRMGSYDLVDALDSGEVDLDSLDASLLPEDMRDMGPQERRSFVDGKRAEREEIARRIAELTERRNAFVREALASEGHTDSFDARLLSILRAQARTRGLSR